MTKEEFMNAVIDYARQTNASITSWGRTVKHNANVGGVVNSWHLSWRAADVVYDAALPHSVRLGAAARYGLTVLAEGDHDHLQPANLDIPLTTATTSTRPPLSKLLPKPSQGE